MTSFNHYSHKLILVFLLFFAGLTSLYSQENITPIHQIQGNGSSSPLYGQRVAVKGIVTADFSGKEKLGGFFVQEVNEDIDEETSEGLFINDPTSLFNGKVGDLVQVIGEVSELKSKGSSLTQLDHINSILILSSNNNLPTPKKITLPQDKWERYEGMLVEISAESGNLCITEMYQMGRFGQITVSSTGWSNQEGTDARLDQFTQFNAPNSTEYPAYMAQLAKRQLIVDDGSGVRNPQVLPYGREGRDFDMFHAARSGDELKKIIGIIDDRFDAYRIHPTQQLWIIPINKRSYKAPKLPQKTTLTVAAFNVLNLFNGNGEDGGFPTARGASSKEEYKRQLDKTVNVILSSGADAMALMEIENDGFGEYSAIQSLIQALNQASGNKRNFTASQVENAATDAISSAIIYDAKKLIAVKNAVTMPTGYGTAAFDSARRMPILQTFRDIKSNEEFSLVAVHFKSKGIQSFGQGNEDRNDGQGRNNALRVHQAEDLVNWLSSKPSESEDPDYLLLGDFNSYAMEDPLVYLDAYNFKTLLPKTSYSFVYDGQWGSLDHALATPGMQTQVTRAVKWHINADEAPVLDYNMEFKSDYQKDKYYDTSVFRSSDHDPVIIGLRLKPSR